MAFPVIKERRNLGDRAYAFRYIFGPDAALVLERVAEEREISLDDDGSADGPAEAVDDDDPLAEMTDRGGNRYKNLKQFSRIGATALRLLNN